MRIIFAASLRKTNELFVQPLESEALADGFQLAYLDNGGFANGRLLQRGAKSIYSWTETQAIRERVAALAPDVLVVHTPSAALALLPFLKSYTGRKIYLCRGGFSEGRGSLISYIWSKVDPATWPYWDRIGVLNTTQRDRLRQSGVDARLIPLGGLSLNKLIYKRPGSTPVNFTLGWVGRFDKDKQLDVFLDLLSRLSRHGHPIRGVVVGGRLSGDRTFRASHAARYSELTIEWTGWLPDPSIAYERMSLLVSTSRREGYGRTIVEAAQFGVPAVAFQTEGTAQSVNDSGGILVPAQSLDAMEERVADLIRSPSTYSDLRAATRKSAHDMARLDVWAAWRELVL